MVVFDHEHIRMIGEHGAEGGGARRAQARAGGILRAWGADDGAHPDGERRFDDLDAVRDLLAANGIGVNLGTGTSSTPAWLTTAHPEILPRTADGTARWPGGRQAFCPSSPIYRERALALVEQVSTRYGHHPALRLWHVSNELGCHNSLCYCDVSADSFRGWLRTRYGTLDALNAAWGRRPRHSWKVWVIAPPAP